MLISEQLFLLLTKDNGRVESGVGDRDLALAAGVLSDLVCHELVEFSEGKNPTVTPVDDAQMSTESEVISLAFAAIKAHPGTKLSKILSAQWFLPKDAIIDALEKRGIITRDQRSFFGIKWKEFPTRDGSVETELRARIKSILCDNAEATVEEALLLAIVEQVDSINHIFKHELEGKSRSEIKARVKQVLSSTGENSRISDQVRRTVDTMQAISIATIAASAITATNT